MSCNESLPGPPGIVRGGVHAGGLKFTSQTEKSTSQFGLKGLFLGTGGTQRCPPRDFFVSHHRGAPPMPNPSPPCKTGRAGVWPTGACSGHNWGLRMRPQSPPGALNTEMWLGAKFFFSSRFTRGARYGKWASGNGLSDFQASSTCGREGDDIVEAWRARC